MHGEYTCFLTKDTAGNAYPHLTSIEAMRDAERPNRDQYVYLSQPPLRRWPVFCGQLGDENETLDSFARRVKGQ